MCIRMCVCAYSGHLDAVPPGLICGVCLVDTQVGNEDA